MINLYIVMFVYINRRCVFCTRYIIVQVLYTNICVDTMCTLVLHSVHNANCKISVHQPTLCHYKVDTKV